MKNCSNMEEPLVAFARGKRLNRLATQWLRTHIAACRECQQKLANEQALSMALSVLASERSEETSPLLENVLRDAFRRESAQKAVSTKKPLVVGIGVTAAAAILLAVAWIGSQPGKPVIDSQPKLAAQGRSDQLLRANSGTSTRDPLAVHTETTSVKADRRTVHKPQSRTSAAQAVGEATEFMRIAYTDSVLPTEQVEVVRVQMPEAALAMFGLPVDGSHLDSKIYADVVVGQDGIPRAIRFVR